jgi:uncharacterized membrane protein
MNNTDTERTRTDKRGKARMVAHFFGMALVRIFLFAVLALVLAFAVVWLWNWLMPGLFGLGLITYWQAFGLMILARLVLGTVGHGFHAHRPYDRRQWGDRFKYHRYASGEMGHGKDFNNTMKWWYNYKRFWKDEGKAAFDEYLKKTGHNGTKDETDGK